MKPIYNYQMADESKSYSVYFRGYDENGRKHVDKWLGSFKRFNDAKRYCKKWEKTANAKDWTKKEVFECNTVIREYIDHVIYTSNMISHN